MSKDASNGFAIGGSDTVFTDCCGPSHQPSDAVRDALAAGRVAGGYAECSRCGCGYLIGSPVDGAFRRGDDGRLVPR